MQIPPVHGPQPWSPPVAKNPDAPVDPAVADKLQDLFVKSQE